MAIDIDQILQTKKDNRQLLQCLRQTSVAWLLTWLDGRRPGRAVNARAPLERLIARKTANVETLYEDPAEKMRAAHQVAELRWRLEQIIDAEEAEEEE